MKATTIAFVAGVFAVSAVMPAAVSRAVEQPQWELVDSNRESDFSYDKSGVRREGNGQITVSTKVEYTPKGKAEASAVMKNSPGMGDLASSVYVTSIDCGKRLSKLRSVSHYNSKAEQIRNVDMTGATEWEKILDDTRMGVVVEVVCR